MILLHFQYREGVFPFSFQKQREYCFSFHLAALHSSKRVFYSREKTEALQASDYEKSIA